MCLYLCISLCVCTCMPCMRVYVCACKHTHGCHSVCVEIRGQPQLPVLVTYLVWDRLSWGSPIGFVRLSGPCLPSLSRSMGLQICLRVPSFNVCSGIQVEVHIHLQWELLFPEQSPWAQLFYLLVTQLSCSSFLCDLMYGKSLWIAVENTRAPSSDCIVWHVFRPLYFKGTNLSWSGT